MNNAADGVALWPRWTETVGDLLRMKALVRSRCCKCGTLMRIEMEDIVARYGPGHALVDRLERCRMVECIGSTFYLATRTYGGRWTTLLRDPRQIEVFKALPPARTAWN